MLEAIKEHLQEVAIDVVLKRVIPSLIATYAGVLASHLYHDDGHKLFSEKSVQALTSMAIFLAHYGLHIWFKLKARDAAIRAAQAETKQGGN